MKCGHCPLASQADACRGERNKRFCQRADPASEAHSPGFLEKLSNFAVAFVEHVAAGSPMATEEVKAARLEVCQGCEHHEPDRCRLCGCNLGTKAGWLDQECPIGKWAVAV